MFEFLLAAFMLGMTAICGVMIWSQKRENRGQPAFVDSVINWIANKIV